MENKANLDDSQLCELIKQGDQYAFEAFQKRYHSVIVNSVRNNITKGGFHKQLSVNYESAMEDLQSEAWMEIYSQIRSNFEFRSSGQLKFYLYRIARSETCKFMRERIKIRKQANTDINLQFPRFDTEYKENPDTFVCMEESLDDLTFSEKALPILINKLSKNESKVLEMQMRGVPQQEIADELGVTVRTVFNLRKKIDDKASRVEVD
ncbi:sigma-70 family RNA polymerase sigma factor [Vibrio cyclitrophicus]|nr:sigma-70 family RNA polymerase sigma factor [Vibrio lentus]PMH99331.1 hypothetical protein BCU54_20475 [Vibrio lentus]